jgi:hypothetical protein
LFCFVKQPVGAFDESFHGFTEDIFGETNGPCDFSAGVISSLAGKFAAGKFLAQVVGND